MSRALLKLAGWVIAFDMRTSGLLEALAPRLFGWAAGLLLAGAAREQSRSTIAPPSVAVLPAEARLLGERIAAVLDVPSLYLVEVTKLPSVTVDIRLGRAGTSEHRSVTEAEWMTLLRAGVPLLAWEHVIRLRSALVTGTRGDA
jgi:hypothetical protein